MTIQPPKIAFGRVYAFGLLFILLSACSQVKLPRIDPYGSRIFLPAPNSTTLAVPRPASCLDRLGNLGQNRNAVPTPVGFPILDPMVDPNANAANNLTGNNLFANGISGPQYLAPQQNLAMPQQNIQPILNVPVVFQNVAAPPCEYQGAIGSCLELRKKARELGVPASNPSKLLQRGQRGELLMTPSKIVAPVGSEVLVLAGICGGDGYFVPHQPLEFMLSQDSVGQMIDYSSRHTSSVVKMLKASTRKTSGDFLTMMTSLQKETIDRGTPTPVDDVVIEKGQAWVSVSSASAGNSYITAVAPKAEAWDKRLRTTEIQWVDALWSIPTPVTATAGAKYPLTTNIRQTADGLGVDNWKVRYEIAGGAAAEFLPKGTQTAEVLTGPDGNAAIEIQQPTDQTGPGTTFIRVDIIRPTNNSAGYEVIESAVTSVRWVAAALTIRTIGPRVVAIATPFSYRLEISNPGDQIARESTVTLEGLPDGLTFVSSTPKPTEYGDRLVWALGDVQPGSAPNIIDIQFKSDRNVGTARLCFDAASQVDQLKTRACAETQVVAPCLAVKIEGDRQGRVGENSTFNLTFVNQCEEDLKGITAVVRYGSGLEVVGKTGGGAITFGPMQTPLPFGESKSLDLVFRVRDEGTHCFQFDVQAEVGHTASIRRCISAKNVSEPSLSMQLYSESSSMIDQEHRVTARVTNTGNVTLTGVVVRSESSASLQPIQSLPQAAEDNGLVMMKMDRIEPNSIGDFTIEYRTISIDGNGFARFQVVTDQGVTDLKEIPIRIVGRDGTIATPGTNPQGPIGIPGTGAGVPGSQPGTTGGVDPAVLGQLGVQIKAVSPVVRREEVFDVEISVTNQRTTSDQNVRIGLQTPPGIVLLGLVGSQSGVTSSPDGLRHLVTPIQEIRSGETIPLVVRLKATQLGNARVEVDAISALSAVASVNSLDLSVTQ